MKILGKNKKGGDNIKTLAKWLESIGFTIDEKYINYFIDAKKTHNNGSEEWVTIQKDSKGYKCKLYQWVNSDLGRKIEYTAATYKEIKECLSRYI